MNPKHPEFKGKTVAHAISAARSIYENTKFASHPVIEAAEEWLNGSPNAAPDDLQRALEAGRLRKSESSGRLFIQL